MIVSTLHARPSSTALTRTRATSTIRMSARCITQELPSCRRFLQRRNAKIPAGAYAGGLAQFYHSGSFIKRINGARAAESGVMAALLTREGIWGPRDITAAFVAVPGWLDNDGRISTE